MRERLPDLGLAALALAFAWACTSFVWQPTLATFADDSVSYLVMAQVFSPYQAADPAVAAAFPREAFYPPLFPLVLALGGAAHDLAWAHGLTALLLAAALPVLYALGARWLDARGAALVAIACVVLLPSPWINAKGILSEPLFALLLAAVYLALESPRGPLEGRLVLGLLMTGLALTRTAALPMLAAYALWAGAQRAPSLGARARAAAPALAALAAFGLWTLLRPAQAENDYAHVLAEKGQDWFDSASGLAAALWASVLRQSDAMLEGWAGSLLLYWVEGQPTRFALAALAGLVALAGLALRLRRNRPDAWLTLAYLATLLAWPFHEQMERFLFPLVPLLVLYAFVAARAAAEAAGREAALAHAVLAALFLALSLPAIAFLHQRAKAGVAAAQITDWYRTPNLDRARSRAQIHLDLFEDMKAIRALTKPGDRVMWVAPSYVALLAGREGLRAPEPRLSPEAYREAVRASGADYVFLSRYHPRDTIRDTAWQAGVRALEPQSQVVHTTTSGGGSLVTSLLLRVPK